jgi:imidazolonepropionase-like amidohydrolase
VIFCLRGGQVWDGVAQELVAADVWIQDGRIAGIGNRSWVADQVMDVSSMVVLPGLIDAHVHLVWSGTSDPVRLLLDEGEQLALLRAAAHAERQLGWGITTVRDLGSSWDAAIAVAKGVERGIVRGSTVVAAGRAIIMTGGHDPFWGLVADGEAAVRAAVRRQWSIGARVIKIAASGGVYGRAEGEAVGQEELTAEEMTAACVEAHRLGLRVAAHAVGTQGIANAVRAGVDTIEHGCLLDEQTAARMAAQGTALCPTALVYQTIASGTTGIPEYAAAKAREVTAAHRDSIALAKAYGIKILAGTDAGSCGMPHPSLVAELEALVALGLTAEEALRAATVNAGSAVLPGTAAGTLTPGAPADVLVVRGDPLADVRSLYDVEAVIHRGEVVDSSAIRR